MLSVGLALLPVLFAIWVISQLRSMSREMTLLRRQLAAIAEHAGATGVAGPPARPSTRTPLWAFAVVLVVFVMVMGLLASLPSAQETPPIDVESESAEIGPSERCSRTHRAAAAVQASCRFRTPWKRKHAGSELEDGGGDQAEAARRAREASTQVRRIASARSRSVSVKR